MTSDLTVEGLLTSPAGFGLTTASPLQRAICRAIDGLPLRELAAREDVQEAFGDVYGLPDARPAEVTLVAGIRTGKSLISAAVALRASQTCDVSRLGPGEVPRVSIVSLTTDLGRVVLGHLTGTVLARPVLRALLVGDPTADGLVLRHPTGRNIEVRVVAAAKAGASLVARWSAGCIFDEAPRMAGEVDGVLVNLDELRAAVIGRLLDGAQLVNVGSPWAAAGPIYTQVEKRHGKPNKHLVVIRAPAPALNPVHWTPERCAALEAQDARAYRRDVLAEFGSADDTAFDKALVTAAVDRGVDHRPPIQGVPGAHLAAFDASGGRRDAYALAIGHRELRGAEGGAPPRDVVVVDLIRRWVPKLLGLKSPDFDKVMDEVAALCRTYGKAKIIRDGYAADAIESALRARGVSAKNVASMSPTRQRERFTLLGQKLRAGDIRIVDDEHAIKELCALREKLHPGGRVSFEAPRGGYDDVADALALLCGEARTLPAAGGDIECVESMWCSFTDGGFSMHDRQWFRRVVSPNGTEMRVRMPPPRGTPEWEHAKAERLAAGIWIPEDEEDERVEQSLNVRVRY